MSGFDHIVFDARNIDIFLPGLDRSYRRMEVRSSFHQPIEHAAMEKHAFQPVFGPTAFHLGKRSSPIRPLSFPLFPFPTLANGWRTISIA